jgi:hypothetical protein
VKEEQVSRIILSESAAVQDHNAEKVKEEQVPEITLSGYIVV